MGEGWGGGAGVIRSDARETPVNATTQEGIYDLLSNVYEVDYDRLPYIKNKPIHTGNTELKVYKEGW